MYIILVYDINTETKEGQRRLNKVFKICKQYLSHIQKSVFEGELTNAKIEELKFKLNSLLDNSCDSVIIFSSRDIKWMNKDLLGLKIDKADNFI
ncbi:MAG TPA: CRISPR-associated endonuclease Cas2 [bacterium]|nr:CRISPR-associated endonuclease Cas2 [bacterium]HOL48899.1 CRISPR-associated endonuclease Cas2 [bacterium]HPQ20142.1 CRISPR-associated endonuclease Cas2 [bacterium]